MRILFFSGELIAGDLAYRLKQEGHEVKLFIDDQRCTYCFDNMVTKTDDWKQELEWVGKEGLIVFDDVGNGDIQDELRADGYNVFGGCTLGDQLEKNREFAQKLFFSHGFHIEQSKDFSDPDLAIEYITNNKCKWVLKQNTHESSLAYVGLMDDGSDVICLINNYRNQNSEATHTISLQKKVDGVEIAISRCFNGNNWISPIFINFEHKPFLNDNIGPLTAEMGTLGWYDSNENSRLFLETLHKLKPYLEKIRYKGFIDINCMVNKDILIPLEATMRFGTPAIHLQKEIHVSPWADF